MKNEADLMMRAMYGQNAIHVAANFVIQDAGDGCCAIVGNSTFGKQLMFGGKEAHQLILCDMIIRPRIVIDSSHLVGMGLSGIIKGGIADADEWIKHGKILIGNI